MASVINEPIVVRLIQPVRNMPIGTELGYRDVADAIAALGSAHYFEVVRTQDGDPIPPLTPEEIEEAQRAARNRAKARRLIIGADLDPIIPGPDKVVVGTASGTKQVDVSTVGGDVDPELVEQRVSEELQGRNLLEGPSLNLPSLLLSPDGSGTPSGAVTPTKVGGVTTVAGRYGQAWRYTATGQRMEIPNTGYIMGGAGTVFVRASFGAMAANGNQTILSGASGGTRPVLARAQASAKANYLTFDTVTGGSVQTEGDLVPNDTPVTIAASWGAQGIRLYLDGVLVASGPFTPNANATPTIMTTVSGQQYPFQTESYLFFTDQIPADEIARISAIDAAHTVTTGWSTGDLVLPSKRTVIGTGGGSAVALRSPNDTVVDLSVTDDGALLVGGAAIGGGSAPLTVTKDGNRFDIVTDLDGAGHLVIATERYAPSQNGTFNFLSASLDDVVIHAQGDDVAPIRAPAAVGANHGHLSISSYTVSGHDKTAADLGSVYTDGENEYTLLSISGSRLVFGHPYTVDGSGVTVAGTTPPAATLTHVSGGTNTASVPITTAGGITQLYPSIRDHSVHYVLDGAEITAEGTHRGNVLRVLESYSILDYKGIIDWARANVGQSFAAHTSDIPGMVRIAATYTFRKGGRCTVSAGLTALRPVTLGRSGIIQAYKLEESAGALWRYMPDVKPKSGVDFGAPVDMTTYSTTIVYGPADYLDPARPPSRYVDWLYQDGTPVVGFTAGYITDKTNSKDSDRAALTVSWDMRGTKKVYPVAIADVTLQPGEHRSFEAFRNYVAPHPSGATLVNVVEDAQAAYVHLDFHQSVTAQAIPLPDHIGKSVTVLHSDGLTVANDTVDASGLTVTVPGTAGRAVVKLT